MGILDKYNVKVIGTSIASIKEGEDRELFREYIGYSVCSGPNGTVSLMTEEEELKYPWAIVGTVSAVPDYEEWGGGEMADRPSVKVDGRIWIKVK